MLHTLDPSCRVERSAPEKSDPGHGANEIPLAWGASVAGRQTEAVDRHAFQGRTQKI